MPVGAVLHKVFDSKAWDYVPLVNVGTNTKILIEKYIHRKEAAIDHYNDRHFKCIKHRSITRCIFASLFPVVSIPVLAPIDLFSGIRKKAVSDAYFEKDFQKGFKRFVSYDDNWTWPTIVQAQNILQDHEYTFMDVLIKDKKNDTTNCYSFIVTKKNVFEFTLNGDGSITLQEMENQIFGTRTIIVDSFEGLFKTIKMDPANVKRRDIVEAGLN